jgi:hypothetical protein
MLSTEHGLPDKQRVAFGRFVDGGDLRLRRGATPKIAYPVETAAAPGLAMRSGAAKMPRQKLQQQERGIIGRMQIDEDQKQRPHRGGVLEEPGGRLEQVEAPASDSRDAAAGLGIQGAQRGPSGRHLQDSGTSARNVVIYLYVRWSTKLSIARRTRHADRTHRGVHG